MGMSKLIAENYIVQLSQKSGTQFSITRFGNIMGGPMVPYCLFLKSNWTLACL
ncbi:polysaccharide biosynthesis protein [Mariniflexile sp.]|uniref:polysaccharide biosynthesis protein n=1 Tax=Mariniflexile sp. TaxID=1979402 RepID=UPI00404772F1